MSAAVDRLNAALEGRYRIERELGEGGMAKVYLADDLRHSRKVAIKVLKPDLAAVVGGDRFLAEIQTTANLQHPHILPLFDSGEADSFLFFVMPYIEGETLRDRLNREKQLPVDEAVGIARSIASALSVAHEQGVVHRDIKPANILLSRGEPVVADFGIALAVTQAGGGRLTETGLSVGTPYYMSPEQATGDRDITASSDVYALGCILYEMLIGEPPYVGNTAQAVLGKILTEKPRQPTVVREVIPLHVDGAVMKALEKLPADRFKTADAFGQALGDPGFRYGESAAEEAAAVGADGSSKFWRRLALFATVGAMALGWALGRGAEAEPEPAPTTRSVFAMPAGQEPVDRLFSVAAFTRDGENLVYLGPGEGGTQLYVKPRGSHEARGLAGTVAAESPETSPDGNWVAYVVNGAVFKVPITGGPSVAIGDSAQTDIGSVAWLDDGTLVYVDATMKLRRVNEDGTGSQVIFTPDSEAGFTTSISALSGSDFLFVRCTVGCGIDAELLVGSSSGGEPRVLDRAVIAAWYLDSGHLILVRPGGSVFGVRFDLGSLSFVGEPIPLFEGVQVDLDLVPDMAVGRSGQLLAQVGGQGSQNLTFYWVSRQGVLSQVDPDYGLQSSAFLAWRLSPDYRRVAFAQSDASGDDIWVKELDAGPAYRITFDESQEYRPEWYPDGESLLFVSQRGGERHLLRRRANATGATEIVLQRDRPISQGIWSPDGEWLVYREGIGDGRDIWAFRPGLDAEPAELIANPAYDEKAPDFSPDGNWITYESNETGQDEVYIRPFPNVEDGKWQVSVGGGREPVWSADGLELFYLKSDNVMMAARIEAGPPFSVLDRTELFSLGSQVTPGNDHRSYDVHEDGRFFFALPTVADDGSEVFWLHIDNWGTELSRLVRVDR